MTEISLPTIIAYVLTLLGIIFPNIIPIVIIDAIA